ncbi:DUF362 domain-containing protein [Salinirubellus sp. GCM10025818]|uniref:DUF362 domain-containing protein n=1 Tax=Salinirubellus TaxID=2162630 RepID=UPI0030D5EBDB
MFQPPDPAALDAVNEVTIEDLPRFAPVRYERDQPAVDDVEATTVDALSAVGGLSDLDPGAHVAITAGSRGIHDMPEVLRTAVAELQSMDLDPFVVPSMGSHGGATAEGQVETLASLGITEESMGCEIVASMDIERVGSDSDGRPVYASRDALGADAVLLANRVKLHTDFSGDVESGLCKMAVIGIGKQRGAEATHKAALAGTFADVIRERASILFEEVPIVGGLALVENANERAAAIEGLDVGEILDREPDLLDRSRELIGTIPIEELDLLVIDEIGKEISGTGMDTNVVGRMLMHGEAEPDSPRYTRIYVRSVTEGSHGNAIGMGLADYAHRRLVEAVDTTDTYVNALTSGEPVRARVPVVFPDDRIALTAAYSGCGVVDPAEMRIARVGNTLDLDRFWVSEPLVDELREDPNADVGTPEPLAFEDGDLV